MKKVILISQSSIGLRNIGGIVYQNRQKNGSDRINGIMPPEYSIIAGRDIAIMSYSVKLKGE
jgi:hypothetical protein